MSVLTRVNSFLNLAREKGVLEFKEVPETGLEKIKNASLGKKRSGLEYLRRQSGNTDDIGYLNPSARLFDNL